MMLVLVGSYVKDISIYLPNVKHIKEDIYDDEILIEKAEDICSNLYILNDLDLTLTLSQLMDTNRITSLQRLKTSIVMKMMNC